LESVTTAADLEHSLSGNYVRGIFGRGREFWALFAVPENEAAEDPARCLTFALLWLGRLRQSSSRKKRCRFKDSASRKFRRAGCPLLARFASRIEGAVIRARHRDGATAAHRALQGSPTSRGGSCLFANPNRCWTALASN
jgi:hypothetical protein